MKMWALCSIAGGLSLPAFAQNEREFSILVNRPSIKYSVPVAGTLDPENVEIVIENIGGAPLVNPRMTVNGRYDWFDAGAIAAEITSECRTDEEKALAIWSWIRYRTHQKSVSDRAALHPVRGLNGYGYGICGHTAAWLKRIATAAGLDARVQELWGHTVAEVYYGGAWHLLDANAKAFYLNRDNRTVASLAQVERDRSLIERTIHPRELEPWVIGPDPPDRNKQFVDYLVSSKDNYEEHSYDQEIAKAYTMAMTLRPAETLARWWTPRLGVSGRITWEPDLANIDVGPYLAIPSWGNIATATTKGQPAGIRVAELQDSMYTRPSVFSIAVESPYPIEGGRFSGKFVKQGGSKLDMVSVFFGPPGWRRGDLHHSSGRDTQEEVHLNLDAPIQRSGNRYEYTVGFALRGNAESSPPSQTALRAFRSETDIHVSPHSLPALALGANTVRFWHQSQGPVKVKITHRWREVHGRIPPGPVTAALAPTEGAEVTMLTPLLQWKKPDAGESADYQVMVCLRPECRFPLSTTLQQNVGSSQREWRVPAGFLNPATTYYWKVRARSDNGDIGPWSPVFRFRTASASP